MISYNGIYWGYSMLTVTGHARLAGDTSGDEDNLSTLQALLQARGSRVVALDLFICENLAQLREVRTNVRCSWC